LYQKRIANAYNKHLRPRVFHEGDLVLKKVPLNVTDPRGKFSPNYEGPYVVKSAFSGGALILTSMDGQDLPHPFNSDSVIKYYA
jgi:hypothetical protein